MIRVAFPVLGGPNSWTGGITYLCNLLDALNEYASTQVQPYVVLRGQVDAGALSLLMPYLRTVPIQIPASANSFSRARQWSARFILQRDGVMENVLTKAGVDIIFQQSAWYGFRFRVPTLAWIADFQHRHLPHMFSRRNFMKREVGYRALARAATRILLSSRDAERDCERFYPAARGKTLAVPFAVKRPIPASESDVLAASNRHSLPRRFFYIPNQFWKHKNHFLVLKSLHILKQQGLRVVIVTSGALSDTRNPSHPEQVLERSKLLGLGDCFLVLGLIPRDDVSKLMQASLAVINPSLSEGWSTTVEEAKSLGVPLLLSNLAVHQEQAPENARYFDPHNAEELAGILRSCWNDLEPGPRPEREHIASVSYEQKRQIFAEQFADACIRTIAAEKMR